MKAFREVAGAVGAGASFRFAADGQATAWVMKDAYCADPECEAPEVDVILIASQEPSRRVRFGVDIIKGEAHWSDVAPLERAIVHEFVTDRRMIRLLTRHRSLVRAWALARWRNGAAVAGEGRCYGLVDFDSRGEGHAMPFESAGKGWFAFDDYCVNPRCPCREAILGFAPENPGSRAVKRPFAVRLDLRGAGAVRTMSGATLAEADRRVLADFQEELGAWQAELALRRKLVREIASIRLKAAAVAPAAAPDASTG